MEFFKTPMLYRQEDMWSTQYISNSKSVIRVNANEEGTFNPDIYDDNNVNIKIWINVDLAVNLGKPLPDKNISEILDICGIQFALSFLGNYYIRYNWGGWKPWAKIS